MNQALGVIEHAPKPISSTASFMDKVKHYGTLQHWTPQEKLIFAADEGVHIGSLFLLNNNLAPVTDHMIRGTTSMLQKFGVDEKKAKDISTMAWVWEAANGLGALAGMGVIAGNHAYGLAEKGALGRFLANRVPTPNASAIEQIAKQTTALGGGTIHP